MITIPTFKIRASSAGQIMTGRLGLTEKQSLKLEELQNKDSLTAKQNDDLLELIAKRDNIELSETAKSYCRDWLTEQIYGYRKEIKSKYLDKGLMMEDEAIDKVIEWLDLPFVIKNTDKFENDYFTGEPDLIVNELDRVDDTKCSWDCYTFPLFEEEIPNIDYFYQLQVYMNLTGRKHASLDYCLMNTPPIIEYGTAKDYSSLDRRFRIRNFEFDYDQSVIDELIKRVFMCREYIRLLISKLEL